MAASNASARVSIGTHSGKFHADEALAIAMLKRHSSLATTIICVRRSREPTVWAECDYLVDVGGVYDHASKRYDHHQSSFGDSFDERHTATILSSAGLVYKHYGRDIIAGCLARSNAHVDATIIDEIFVKMYEQFIEPFDAVDNGVERYAADSVPRYAKPYDIFGMVSDLNPEWNQSSTDDDVMVQFEKALELVGSAFDRHMEYYCLSWLAARTVVEESLQKSLDDPELKEARALKLIRNCPWKEHLFELERRYGCELLYCIYPEEVANGWRIQAVPTRLDSFETRQGLPDEWRGKRDAELDGILSGLSPAAPRGAVFVHKTGFIGGHRDWAGVLIMAKLAAQTCPNK